MAEEPENTNPFLGSGWNTEVNPNYEGNIFLQDEDVAEPAEVVEDAEINFINSKMYDGMSQEEAIKLYKELKAKAEAGDTEGFANSFIGGLTYTNPDTGLKEGVPIPEVDWDLGDPTTWFKLKIYFIVLQDSLKK